MATAAVGAVSAAESDESKEEGELHLLVGEERVVTKGSYSIPLLDVRSITGKLVTGKITFFSIELIIANPPAR